MKSKDWLNRQKNDFYVKKARKYGYLMLPFKLFKRFLVFCHKGSYQNFDSYKIKLGSLGFTVNGFEEFNTFKWKSL